MTVNELISYYGAAQPLLLDTWLEQYRAVGRLDGDQTNLAGSGLLIPLSGRAQYTLNGTVYDLRPGVVLHAGASMKLSKKSVGDKPWRYMVLHYKIAAGAAELRQYHDSHFLITTGVSAQIADMALRLHNGRQLPDELAGLRSKTVFAALIEEIVAAALRYSSDSRESLMDEAINILRTRYRESITIGRLAADSGMSLKQFSALFRKKMGVAAIDYLTDLRLRQARELLITGEHSVRQVAASVGYEDSYYFSRLFKRRVGLSPSALTAGREIGASPEGRKTD
ncbi:MAG: AraC family transcriptional regulator [Peptococcaceae bacterium]|nr:AraC family transcriptional regulator [Peptococcaceae bacterium]